MRFCSHLNVSVVIFPPHVIFCFSFVFGYGNVYAMLMKLKQKKNKNYLR